MGLFDLFRKSPKQREEEESRRLAQLEDLEIYSGMRVEVTSDDGRMFLVARLVGLRGDRAQLKPSTDGNLLTKLEEPVAVTLRGYSSKENKAVVIEGTLRPGPNNTWQAEHLVLVKRSNDRAFFRMDTNLMGSITAMGRLGAAAEDCRVLNVSVGGVCIGSTVRHNIGDKFLLRVRLLPNTEANLLMCQIIRIIERRYGSFEYGCRFLELSEPEEEKILQIIFEMQRQARNGVYS